MSTAGIDGRRVVISEDKREGNVIGYVLGGYLQNGESTIMKWANIEWRKKLVQEGIYFRQLNFIHDEWQTEAKPEEAEMVGRVQSDSISSSTDHFGLHCPMAGDFRVGDNWYETH